MKNFPKLFPASAFSAMEISRDKVLVVTADKKENGELLLLGGGEARLEGLEKGEITNAGDLVEAISEAAAKAEKSAGARPGKLYFNLDDPKIESAWPSGSRILDGEGEIQASDVRAAVDAAERLAGNFEKKIVYAAETGFLIDDKDSVADPVGIFGHKLEVTVHLILARADRLDAWSRLLLRAGFSGSIPVLSGLSSARAVLGPDEKTGQRIVWDLGRDYLNGLVMANGRVLEYRTLLSAAGEWDHDAGVVLALCQEFYKKYPGLLEVVLTGELSADEKFSGELKAGLEIPVRSAAVKGMARLSEPSHAAIAGLIGLAGEIERKTVILRPQKHTLSQAREKLRSFLSDYF